MGIELIIDALAPESRALFQACLAALAESWQPLKDKPEETAVGTVAALWHAASGIPLSVRRATESALPALEPAGVGRLHELLARRINGVPLAYLVCRQYFMGLDLIASDEALIPREETELLGRAALDLLRTIADVRTAVTVIDVCTGSGNLAIALACYERRARVWGADLSAAAVALAQRNVAHLESAWPGLASRIIFRAGDLLAPFDAPDFHGAVDLLVCNPPYISSAKVDGMAGEIIDHEPRLAFDGGPLGIAVVQRLLHEAPRYLRPGGWLAMEIGLGQGRGLRRRLEASAKYDVVHETPDCNGQTRVLAARLAQDFNQVRLMAEKM